MKEESPQRSKTGHVIITAALALWLAGSAYMGVMVAEFHAGVEAAGYGHRASPTMVSWGYYAFVALIVGALVTAIFAGTGRRLPKYLWGLAGGVVLWLPTAMLGMLVLSSHYERVCDRAEAPSACYSASFDAAGCGDGDDSDDCRRLKRACRFGHRVGCQRLLEMEAWTQEEVCHELATTCEKTRQCGSDAHPRHCDADSVAPVEASWVSSVCEVYSEECG